MTDDHSVSLSHDYSAKILMKFEINPKVDIFELKT